MGSVLHSPVIVLSTLAAVALIAWGVVGGTRRDRAVARRKRARAEFEARAAADPDWGLVQQALAYGIVLDVAGDVVSAAGQSGGRFTGSRASVQDAAAVQGDPVLRKMLLLGAAGAFLPDKDGREVFVTVEGDGFALVTRVAGGLVVEVRRFAAAWNTRSGALNRPSQSQAQSDVAGRLAQLGRMHAAGQLTDSEFTAAKARILGG